MGFKATVKGGSLNLRADTDKNSEQLASIPSKTTIYVKRIRHRDWIQAAYKNQLGYVMKEFLDMHPHEKGYGVEGFLRYGAAYLEQGSKGMNVKKLQRDLNDFISARLNVDGIFGPKTEAAVKQYQKVKHIQVDGVAGIETKNCLFEDWMIKHPRR